MKFKKSDVDDCIFIKRLAERIIIIGVYVDDLLITSNDSKLIESTKIEFNEQITISDRGKIKQFLNLEIEYNREIGTLSISQRQYVDQLLLEDFDMSNCKVKKSLLPTDANFELRSEFLMDKSIYLSVVGRLIHLSTKGRYDILYAVSQLCRFMNSPTTNHLQLAKYVLKYLSFTKNYKLHYEPKGNGLKVYCDSNYTDNRSTTGICTVLFNCLVNCISKKQSNVSTSTTQAETNAIAEGIYDQIYIYDFLTEFDSKVNLNRTIVNHNQSSIQAVISGGNFSANRHYRSKINLIRENVNLHDINLEYVKTSLNCADAFTKPLNGNKLIQLLKILNLRA